MLLKESTLVIRLCIVKGNTQTLYEALRVELSYLGVSVLIFMDGIIGNTYKNARQNEIEGWDLKFSELLNELRMEFVSLRKVPGDNKLRNSIY